ncbi:hypothetical protein [Nocardia jiangxiensis]|uniref:hypothetical protein n=1 Tax=Nocardia jiangxiensis TaxID=282685 RepID=UPI000688700B|nr:hypothetical protein [Nocardia jiangxiensis]
MDRTDRLYTLVEDLRGAAWRRRTTREPAARCAGVRTMERDVPALPQTEARIPAPVGRTGGCTPDRRMPLPPFNFSLAEVIVIGATPRRLCGMPFETSGAPGKNMADMTDESAGAARDLAARVRVIEPIAVPPAVVQAACRAACGAPRARARDVPDRPIRCGERVRGGGAAADVRCRGAGDVGHAARWVQVADIAYESTRAMRVVGEVLQPAQTARRWAGIRTSAGRRW